MNNCVALDVPGGSYFGQVDGSATVLNDLWRFNVDDTQTPPMVNWTKVQTNDHSSQVGLNRPEPRASASVFNLPYEQGVLVVAGQGWRHDDATGLETIGEGLPVSDAWLRVTQGGNMEAPRQCGHRVPDAWQPDTGGDSVPMLVIH